MPSRLLIMGYGSIGKRHHAILHKLFPHSHIDVYDPVLKINESLDVSFHQYDIGVICTPTILHLKNAASIADNCNFLFIEKPLHNDIEEIIKYKHVLARKDIHVGCNIRYTEAVKKLKEISNKSKVVRVTSMSNLLKWRDDSSKKAYSFTKHMGGGVLHDFIHEPDFVFDCFGKPSSVSKYEMRLFDATIDSNDTCLMNWQYEDKLVSFCLSYCSNDYVRRIEVLDSEMKSTCIEITREDIEASYVRQWNDIIANGPKNSYDDCVTLYGLLAAEKM